MTQKTKGLEYINKQYRTNYVKGMRLAVDGQFGQLRGGRKGNLAILFDGDQSLSYVHPTFRVRLIRSYLPSPQCQPN